MPTSTQSIREIVSNQSSAAAVLQRFDIDLCSRADESLKQACAELQLSVDQVLEKLSDAAANEPGAEPADLASYSMSRLIQHIVRTHHQYVRRELPRLAEMAHKVAGKHGDRAPELRKIERLLDELADRNVRASPERGTGSFPVHRANGSGGGRFKLFAHMRVSGRLRNRSP